MTAMLNRLAPSAAIPPSWKISAWALTTMVMTNTAAHGPSKISARAAPSRWPDVPPATGKLSICPAKIAAATTPINGTLRSSMSRLTRMKA